MPGPTFLQSKHTIWPNSIPFRRLDSYLYFNLTVQHLQFADIKEDAAWLNSAASGGSETSSHLH